MITFRISLFTRRPARIALRRACWWGGLLSAAVLGYAAQTRAGGVVSNLTEADLRAKLADGGNVTFATNGTITLSAPLLITMNTTLDGAGQSVTISGGGVTSLLSVATNLTLRNLTLADGKATNGGCLFIQPAGVVVATNCIFTRNNAVGTNGTAGANGADTTGIGGNGHSGTDGSSALGGAVFNLGQLTFLGCQFLTNSATGGNGAAGGNGGMGDFQGGNGGRGGNGGAASGGAVYSAGSLVVSNCTFSGNSVLGGTAAAGGAAGSGPFPGLSGNGGSGGGADGAALCSLSNLVVVNCTFSDNAGRGGNSAAGGQQPNGNGTTGAAGGDAAGGGLWCAGLANVTNCTFYGNAMVGGDGGDGGNGDLLGGDGGRGGYGIGGGVCNGGTLRLVNCTAVSSSSLGGLGGLAGSAAFPGNEGGNPAAHGGNIANSSGVFILKCSILAHPASGTNSFAITNVVTTTNVVVSNCSTNVTLDPYTLFPVTNITCTTNTTVVTTTNIVGSTNAATVLNAYGTITDAGNNLSSDASPAFGSNSRNNTDPQLGPLANYGGPTQTLLPQAGSPAIDAGDDAASLAFDQRGVPRPQGLHSDIGAVEVLARVPTTLQWPAVSSANFTFAFMTQPGFSYVTEFKSALSDTGWTRLNTNLGTGGLLTNSAPVAGSAGQFFRVRIE